jgi:ankyrin repeat protein
MLIIRRGETPLYFATRAGALELVKFLLMHGADPNIRSEDGSPKDVAAKHSNKELSEILSMRTIEEAEVEVEEEKEKEKESKQEEKENPYLFFSLLLRQHATACAKGRYQGVRASRTANRVHLLVSRRA